MCDMMLMLVSRRLLTRRPLFHSNAAPNVTAAAATSAVVPALAAISPWWISFAYITFIYSFVFFTSVFAWFYHRSFARVPEREGQGPDHPRRGSPSLARAPNTTSSAAPLPLPEMLSYSPIPPGTSALSPYGPVASTSASTSGAEFAEFMPSGATDCQSGSFVPPSHSTALVRREPFGQLSRPGADQLLASASPRPLPFYHHEFHFEPGSALEILKRRRSPSPTPTGRPSSDQGAVADSVAPPQKKVKYTKAPGVHFAVLPTSTIGVDDSRIVVKVDVGKFDKPILEMWCESFGVDKGARTFMIDGLKAYAAAADWSNLESQARRHHKGQGAHSKPTAIAKRRSKAIEDGKIQPPVPLEQSRLPTDVCLLPIQTADERAAILSMCDTFVRMYPVLPPEERLPPTVKSDREWRDEMTDQLISLAKTNALLAQQLDAQSRGANSAVYVSHQHPIPPPAYPSPSSQPLSLTERESVAAFSSGPLESSFNARPYPPPQEPQFPPHPARQWTYGFSPAADRSQPPPCSYGVSPSQDNRPFHPPPPPPIPVQQETSESVGSTSGEGAMPPPGGCFWAKKGGVQRALPIPPNDHFFVSKDLKSGLEALAAHWDPSFPEWNPDADWIKHDGNFVPITAFPRMYKSTDYWKAPGNLRAKFSQWHILVDEYRRLGSAAFLQKFTKPDGSGFQAVKDVKKTLSEEAAAEAKKIRDRFGAGFDSIFCYGKGAKHRVMKDSRTIIKHLKDHPELEPA
ncbi:hypothetical protein B0H16DRAFT_1722108 [Mycena metata]|uniref:Uncharacterized protein n=1 Tax=Mycena metata TaxID=1033252 RepID=A0AAD7J2X6_9AGAR|nr:hypothetical protein B0H16DRAFT_1722108 [Mycena metata]